MSTNTKQSGSNIQTQLEGLLAGLKLGLPTGVTLTINGQSLDANAAATMLQQLLAPFDAVDTAKAEYEQALAVRDEAIPATKKTAGVVTQAVLAYCGGDTTKLTQFGIEPPKERRQLTSEEYVARAQKAAETRKLRGTLGKRQKEGVKSQSDVTVSTTSTLPGTPAPSPAPTPAPTPVSLANVVTNGAANGSGH
jgi:hypothetical protein